MCGSQRKKMILLFAGPSLLYHLFALKGEAALFFLPKMLLNSVATFTTISATSFSSRNYCHLFHLSSRWWRWWCQIFGAQRPPSGQFLCRQGNWWDRGSASREYSQNILHHWILDKISYDSKYFSKYLTPVNTGQDILRQWIFLRIPYTTEYWARYMWKRLTISYISGYFRE